MSPPPARTEDPSTAFNPAAERMFGWSEAEVLGRSPVDVVSVESPGRTAQARAAVLRHGRYAAQPAVRAA